MAGALQKMWDFFRVRKIWWITPLVLLLLLLSLLYFAGESVSVANVYAPI